MIRSAAVFLGALLLLVLAEAVALVLGLLLRTKGGHVTALRMQRKKARAMRARAPIQKPESAAAQRS